MNLVQRAKTILADANASHDAKALAEAILREFDGDAYRGSQRPRPQTPIFGREAMTQAATTASTWTVTAMH